MAIYRYSGEHQDEFPELAYGFTYDLSVVEKKHGIGKGKVKIGVSKTYGSQRIATLSYETYQQFKEVWSKVKPHSEYDIKDVEWFSGRDTVGAVLITTKAGYKAYIGPALGANDEEADAQYIAQWGAKLPFRIARGMFSHVWSDRDVIVYDGTKIRIDQDILGY